MAEKYFKVMVVAFFCIAGFSLCRGLTSSSDDYNVSVTQMIDADKGLDLRAVGEVLKKVSTAEEFEKLLNASDIEAIAVCTPVHSHYELASAALEAGKHVLVEKPLTNSVEHPRQSLFAAVYQRLAFVRGLGWLRGAEL